MSLGDSIHYGVYPSFITELAKWAFAEPRVDLEEMIPRILAMHFGHAQLDAIVEAMKLWSEAFANMVPTNEDQYGALRIGPSHPFFAGRGPHEGVSPPQDKFACHKMKAGMYNNNYCSCSRGDAGDIRIPKEVEAYEYVKECLYKGIKLLESVQKKNEELERLINMGYFMWRTIITTLNRKHYFILDQKRMACKDPAQTTRIIEDMIALLRKEQENASATIPIVEFDSVLGFEPSIEYVTDRKRLEWKISQVEEEIEMLQGELAKLQH